MDGAEMVGKRDAVLNARVADPPHGSPPGMRDEIADAMVCFNVSATPRVCLITVEYVLPVTRSDFPG